MTIVSGFADISILQLLLVAMMALFASIIGGLAGYGTGALMPLVRFKIMPHWHGETRTAVVLSGTFYYANGDQWDESKFKAYPPGSFLIEPAKISHYAMAKDGEVVFQATSLGPSSTIRIEQAKK